ncbi:hypothetical protein E1293_33135 [Actinomadura darangshiensis]|uniref:Uncharacterized protein n=1 Tax=Actinomadura darangshiensis TaxID=705336 RepID=A0A4R5AKG6_9ACTN|nr:hypothetical protein [Actinomadura darangshiensis]TDD72120.1 hypothetical protein E1293_33135 [Actinomadura darangshiensis]
MTVLMLARDGDKVAERVAAELRGRGTSEVQVNPSNFPTRLSMGAHLSNSTSWGGRLRSRDGLDVELAGISAV